MVTSAQFQFKIFLTLFFLSHFEAFCDILNYLIHQISINISLAYIKAHVLSSNAYGKIQFKIKCGKLSVIFRLCYEVCEKLTISSKTNSWRTFFNQTARSGVIFIQLFLHNSHQIITKLSTYICVVKKQRSSVEMSYVHPIGTK